jgi:hypothetical protein
MTDEEEPLDSHVIELADTRPTMVTLTFFGLLPFLSALGALPLNAAILLGTIAALCGVYGGIKYCIWLPFAWWVVAQLVKENYHGLTHLQKYLETGNLTCLDKRKQGGVSATPFPKIKGKHRGMV